MIDVIDITLREVYFDEMWLPLDDYLTLVEETTTLDELRFRLWEWKTQHPDCVAA